MGEQAFAEVSEVPVWVTLRRYTFIDLYDVYGPPGNSHSRQIAQHEQWGLAPTGVSRA